MAPRRLSDIMATPNRISPEQRAAFEARSQDDIDRLVDQDDINPTMSDEALDRAVFARSVREARDKLGLTQPVFAQRFHIKLTRLRDWERARYAPDSVAVAYIKTILLDAETVERALAD
jgi:putative transcriptional regulator